MNPAQPQTLQIAVFLLYINAAFAVLDLLLDNLYWPFTISVVLVFAGASAAWGLSNERKWGYWLALAVAIFPFAGHFYYSGNPFARPNILSLMFEIALVALLVHPQSREYERIWFK
jgi:hypothetical protein